MTKNVHGRVGVKRRTGTGAPRATTNQALRLRCQKLETQLRKQAEGTVPVTRAATLWLALTEVHEMTAKSKTGVAKKVHEYVDNFLNANA